MSSFIPFVNSLSDIVLVRKYYANAPVVRVSLANAELVASLAKTNLWLDAALDAYDPSHSLWKSDGAPYDQSLHNLHGQLTGYEVLCNLARGQQVDDNSLVTVCNSLLQQCNEYKPKWISVPQLPLGLDRERNKVNRLLAKVAGEWRSRTGFSGRIVLPILVAHQSQTSSKLNRTKILEQAKKNLSLSGADALWVVDYRLTDWKGPTTLKDRFGNLIRLHEGLQSIRPGMVIIAGPYWALNILLWARGLVTHAAVGTGRAYQYFLPGGPLFSGKIRIALSPLRRIVVAGPKLDEWLKYATQIKTLSVGVRDEFTELHSRLSSLMRDPSEARQQIAEFYGKWCSQFESLPAEGRPLALYQDFSQAYVIGKTIAKLLPDTEKPATKPGQVAEQLMLNCL